MQLQLCSLTFQTAEKRDGSEAGVTGRSGKSINGRKDNSMSNFPHMGLCMAAFLTLGLLACSGTKDSDDADESMDAPEEQDGDLVLDPDIQTDDAAGDDSSGDCEDVVCDDPCVYHVDLNVTAPGDGLTPGAAFPDVQSGIDAAAGEAGACCTCDVHVAEGIYYVHAGAPEDTILLREGVRVYGGHPTGFSGDRDPGAHVTVLDGRAGDAAGSPRVFHVVTGSDRALIDGFTITQGRAVDDDDILNSNNYGGGMVNYITSPDVVGCSFEGNEAVFGGGLYAFQSEGTIISSTFTGNRAEESGGGLDMRQSSPQITNCSFSDNEARLGGGMYVRAASSPAVALDSSLPGNCAFAGNSAESGGGMYVSFSSPLVRECRFETNDAGSLGGGASVEDSSVSFEQCTFTDNLANVGGGVDALRSTAGFDQCLFDQNNSRITAVCDGVCEGGAVSLRESTGTVDTCSFTANGNDHGYLGGGLSAHDSEATFLGSTFDGNISDVGGAVHLDDTTATVAGCLFDHNHGEQAGALHAGESDESSPLLVVNCIFSGNTSASLAAVNVEGSDTTIANCTFYDNDAVADGASALRASPDAENPTVVVNSIFWENFGGSECRPIAGEVALTYSLVQCWTTYVDDYVSSADPLFADEAAGDFRLWPISLAVDFGSREALVPDSLDLDADGDRDEPIPHDFAGNDRVQGATVDRGALEMPPNDHDNWPRIHVDAAAGGANDGSTWNDAYTDLSAALAAVTYPMQIWVAAGTYKPPRTGPGGTGGTFELVRYTGLFGGFDPAGGADTFAERDWTANETVLSGDLDGNDGPDFANYTDNVLHVVTDDDGRLVMDGFTVSGGNANEPPGPFGDIEDSVGGGMVVNFLETRIRNCRFVANRAYMLGGGIFGGASPENVWVTNCIFEGNRAGEYAGGIAGGIVTNCTVVNNHAALLGGAYSVLAMNSIFWGNTSDEPTNPQVWGYLSHCDIENGISLLDPELDGGGNIMLDPLFETGSLRLSTDSPCIDAGDNVFVFSMTDCGLDPRIVDGDGHGSDEAHCRCPAGQFVCADGSCIDGTLICDGGDDCGDGSDEADCECEAGQFACQGGGCIDSALICDGNEDCLDPSADVDMGAFEYQP
jgi:hypothetical protein